MRLLPLIFVPLLLLPLQARAQVSEHSESDRDTPASPQAAPDEPARDFSSVVDAIVNRTQEFRQQKDLQSVQSDPQLTETAEYFAQYMAKTGQYGHAADGRRPSERARAHGYEYCLVSENIAHVYSTQRMSDEELARRFFEGWKESPEHRENMLDPAVTDIGVAVAQSEESGYIFAVQMFGLPRSAAMRFEISNQSEATLRYQLGDRTLELPPGYTRTHERCRSAELTFLSAQEGQQEPQSIKPRSGDRITAVQTAEGAWQIQRQPGDAPAQDR